MLSKKAEAGMAIIMEKLADSGTAASAPTGQAGLQTARRSRPTTWTILGEKGPHGRRKLRLVSWPQAAQGASQRG